ncbi:hypothetical protein PTSG_05783 [Salpingoeca rosetta]|uniref:Uncharacterized protein n=1 Tax=Salpingoeca rosetta (strain ATCC 50818 / BSB-021) TaxID=946362 RepID=F2UB78_SALR5|nr:uncharacterized protein PTSG_05783 [Salpingoeca rosetta]EGD74091.1 hypothetical protein PTSG_05783 [Salpingoeca rosetta]|eukprot:XP_004993653.1 hypothetical protein PTSG_05783 [Salpingoeca rosetta]
MSFSILAVDLLKYGCFPKFQDCRKDLQEFNPYALNLFVSHRWLSKEQADDGRYYKQFVGCLLRIINRCINIKFLDDEKTSMGKMFNPEYLQDRSMGYDLFRHILTPTKDEVALLEPFLDTARLSEECIRDIFAYLNDINVWFDWTCAPQHPRSAEEEGLFQQVMGNLHTILEHSYTVCLWDGSEFSRGWCIVEVLIARTLRLLMFYDVSEAYDTRAHQRERAAPLNMMQEVKEMSAARDKTPANYFDFASQAPEYLAEIEELDTADTILAAFEKHGIQCSYSTDADKVANIYATYKQKYKDFQRLQPIYSTRVPADFRSKIVNTLRNLYDGGEKLFSPVLFEYVSAPSTTHSEEKYLAFVQASIAEPFYWGMMVTFYPRLITTEDPVRLLETFFFGVEDATGVVYNNDLTFTTDDPIDENIALVRNFPRVRCKYDFNLGLVASHVPDLLRSIRELTINGEVVARAMHYYDEGESSGCRKCLIM